MHGEGLVARVPAAGTGPCSTGGWVRFQRGERCATNSPSSGDLRAGRGAGACAGEGWRGAGRTGGVLGGLL